jgi:hypothetical protein
MSHDSPALRPPYIYIASKNGRSWSLSLSPSICLLQDLMPQIHPPATFSISPAIRNLEASCQSAIPDSTALDIIGQPALWSWLERIRPSGERIALDARRRHFLYRRICYDIFG